MVNCSIVLTGNRVVDQTPGAAHHWILLHKTDVIRNLAVILISVTFGEYCFYPLEVQNLWQMCKIEQMIRNYVERPSA
jgi:hypothetical protein